MERAIAEMEKIRRAEEIYSRRKNAEDEEKRPKNIYKILFEILFLVNVIIVIVAVQNQKYIFTKEFIDQVNKYNINIRKKVEEWFSKEKTKAEPESNIIEESQAVSGESNDVQGALVENETEQEMVTKEETAIELSQEEKDILDVQKYSIIMPVTGTKTSGFGERESTNSKVTKYHTGVDIAAENGTPIFAATSGKVVQVSSSGDYGKHVKIQTDELLTLYAHCSKIDVQEGQEINQGDKIAEVGSTGNSTGPHLHFEIRFQERLVNPEKILEF